MRLLLSLIFTLLLIGCDIPPERKWAAKQTDRCHIMGGNIFWDSDAHSVECWRTAFMNPQPQKLFDEKYK